mgnify:CR=1 FL=1
MAETETATAPYQVLARKYRPARLSDLVGQEALVRTLASAIETGRIAHAADLPHVDEAGPQAQALGYVHDATKADKVKFPAYVAGSQCSGCQLYQGGAAEWGACALFAGSAVSGKGWCSAFAKKA